VFDFSVHAYLRASAVKRALRIGPFLALFDEDDPGRYFNYAVPDDGTEPAVGEVAELVTVFRDRSRTPRLEYLPRACPAVEPALLAAGFTVEAWVPILTCPPEYAAAPAVFGIEVILAGSDDQLRQAADVQAEAYGQPMTDHDVARLHGVVDRGGLVALAVDTNTGTGVGAGMCGPPHRGVSELAAVGVRQAYRRRGIAAAVAASLTRSGLTVGITNPFLMALDETEERIYHRVGYRRVTQMLHISQQ
jgi:GNAT superfamily N-acetyltransferase